MTIIFKNKTIIIFICINTIMATTMDNEISETFEEMKKLQAKIERIQKEQKEKDKRVHEREFKQQEIEPNLKFMSDWLDKYGETYDEKQRMDKLKEKSKKIQDISHKVSIRMLELTPEEQEIYDNRFSIQEQYEESIHRSNSKGRRSRNNKYSSFEPGYPSRNEIKESRNEIKEIETYVENTNMGGYFMKQFIESAHNLFLIQEKRIAELEKKLNQ